MNKASRNIVFLLAVLFYLGSSVTPVQAQDPKRQYKNAKAFFTEGKYNLAMESFKPLLVYDKDNPYCEYASFYYAQAALNQHYYAVAKDMLLQIRKLYPEWDQMNEVNFWLAKIYFDQVETFQGMHTLKSVKQEDYIEIQEISKLKLHYLSQISDPEILRLMWEEYPQDEVVGKCLARSISRQPFELQDQVLLDSVIKHFGLPRQHYVSPRAIPVMKDSYNVTVMFPFLTATLDPSPNVKQNQLVLDLYEGMRMATDSLNSEGPKIKLLAYDTERNPEVVKKLLESQELMNTDLIIGPLFGEEVRPVLDFSEKNQINMINPVSTNSEFVGKDPYAFLFLPSLETMGAKSAELLASRTKNKNCMVFYGEKQKDSVLAMSFINRAKEVGLNVNWSEEFRKETAARILTILAKPTEFDDLKNPKQFSLELDSIGSVFVASDDPLIYTKVISCVETRGDSVLIVGSESWLDNTSVDLTKYERIHVMFAAPNYTSARQPEFIAFRKKFIKTHGAFPPEYMNYTKLGYDFMMFTGHVLKKYGVYFQEGLTTDGLMPGWFSKGYRLSAGRSNLEFPFIYFRNGELVTAEEVK